MLKVEFHDINRIPDGKYKFAVVMARTGEGWLFVRHKDRSTWEIPGGHREKNETVGRRPSASCMRRRAPRQGCWRPCAPTA